MSQTEAQANSEDRNPSIERAGKHKWGYNISQVDDFLDRTHDMYEAATPVLTQEYIQLASFDLEKNGYVISQVDAALIRLEKAVVDRRTQYSLQTEGEDQWQKNLLALARTLQERAEAQPKHRFSRGERRQPSYTIRQVDQIVSQAWTNICDRLGIRTSAEPAAGAQEITASRVSNVIFTQSKGHRGYSEASVDAYLNRCVQVLTRVESYERVTGQPLQPFAMNEGPSLPLSQPQSQAQSQPQFESQSQFSPVTDPAASASQASHLASLVTPIAQENDDRDRFTSNQPNGSASSTSPDSVSETAPFSPLTDVEIPSSVAHTAPAQATASAPAQATPLPTAGTPTTPAQQAHTATPSFAEQNVQQPQQLQQPTSSAAPAQPMSVETDLQPVDNQQANARAYRPVDLQNGSANVQAHTSDGEGYLSSILNSSVTATGSFEIPDLTFPDHYGSAQSGANTNANPGASNPQEPNGHRDSGADRQQGDQQE